MTDLPTLSYTSTRKSTPFGWSLPVLAIIGSTPLRTSTMMGFRLNKHSFLCVSFLSRAHARTKKYKFLETRVLRKRTFSRTLSKGRCFYIMMDKRQTRVKVLTSLLFIDHMFTTLKMAGKDKSIAGAIEAGVRGRERKP